VATFARDHTDVAELCVVTLTGALVWGAELAEAVVPGAPATAFTVFGAIDGTKLVPVADGAGVGVGAFEVVAAFQPVVLAVAVVVAGVLPFAAAAAALRRAQNEVGAVFVDAAAAAAIGAPPAGTPGFGCVSVGVAPG
jgi:hypothetical protein